MDGYTTYAPDEINGFSVIASALVDHVTRVILAEGYRSDGDGAGRLIYVVSTAPAENDGSGWHNGRYFDSPSAARGENLRNAREAFARLVCAEWSVAL